VPAFAWVPSFETLFLLFFMAVAARPSLEYHSTALGMLWTMLRYPCPHCRESLEAPAELIGQDVQCPRCGQRTIVPRPVASLAGRDRRVPSGVTVPLLVSAIGNIVVSLIWISTCFLSFLAIPLIILCIFEFVLYSQAGRIPLNRFASKAKTLGIFEVIAGLLNTITLVCGIIVLVNSSRIQEDAAPTYGY